MSARRRPLLLLPALLAATGVPAAAADLQRECRAVRALVNGDGRHFADFDFEAHPRLSVPVRLDRRRVAIVDDERCDADSGDESASMECTWTFSDYQAAAGFYEALVDRLRTCLGQPVLPPEPDPDDVVPRVTVHRDLREHRADIVLAGWESELELRLSEDPQDASKDGRQPASVRYEIALSVDSGILVDEEEESDAAPPSAAID
jgi:hypothetical protein